MGGLRIFTIVKNGNQNLYSTGRIVNTVQAKGFCQKDLLGNYYERTTEVIDGVPTQVTSDSLGTSV